MKPKLHRAALLKVSIRIGAIVALLATLFFIDGPILGLDPAWAQTFIGLAAAAIGLGPVARVDSRRYRSRVTAPRAAPARTM